MSDQLIQVVDFVTWSRMVGIIYIKAPTNIIYYDQNETWKAIAYTKSVIIFNNL